MNHDNFDNVTMRRNKARMSNTSDASADQSFTSVHSDLNSKSLPDLSTDFQEFNELTEQIKDLKASLEQATKKIQDLTSQNISLQKQLGRKQYVEENNPKKQQTSNKSKKPQKNNRRSSPTTLGQDRQESTESIFGNGLKGGAVTHSQMHYETDSNDLSITVPRETLIKNKHEAESEKSSMKKRKSRLLILGSQQLIGLSYKLAKIREWNKCYEDYSIFSFLKPYAKVDEILKTCDNLGFNENDQIVLCVGENDTNPTIFLHELSGAIKLLNKCNIIIINVNYNKALNVNTLNSYLKNLCTQLPNCEFISIEKPFLLSRSEYILYLCRKINFIIDSRYYEKTYLTGLLEQHKNNLRNHYIKEHQPKKGTIPYYFKKKETVTLMEVYNTPNVVADKTTTEGNRRRFFRAKSI